MHLLLRHLVVVAGVLVATQAMAQISFYEQDNLRGQSFSTQKPINDFTRFGLNDRSSLAEVMRGRWEVCEDSRFNGPGVLLRQGSYPSLAAMGLNNQVSSVRPVSQNTRVDEHRYAPLPAANAPDFRLRQNERLDVQHSQEVSSQAPPEFWDVAYNFRGLDHHVHLPPDPSITVNRRGEPRA